MYHHESEEIYKLLNYDAILFDVDGTLIDSAPGIINTLKEVFVKMGVDTTNVNLPATLAHRCERALVSTLPTRPSLKRPPT
mgnify:CR=1 FL=1